jgi:hypothetical protein
MPIIPVEALLRTISEQRTQIDELMLRIADLEFLLEMQNEEALAAQLAELLMEHSEKGDYAIIASTDFH